MTNQDAVMAERWLGIMEAAARERPFWASWVIPALGRLRVTQDAAYRDPHARNLIASLEFQYRWEKRQVTRDEAVGLLQGQKPPEDNFDLFTNIAKNQEAP